MLTVKIQKAPPFGELLNEVKLRGSIQILDLARLNALDAKARLVGNRDLLFVEHGTAEDGVLTAQHGAVQIHAGDDLLCAGQMHGGIHADLGFQHTADHALHAVHLGQRMRS